MSILPVNRRRRAHSILAAVQLRSYRALRFLTIPCILAATVSPLAATNYIAYSLRAAEAALTAHPNTVSADLHRLGGMTRVTGVVYDPQNKDLILIGEHYAGGAQVTLDDLAVALRSRLVLRKWPEVSIDPTPDTPRTGYLKVRVEGGIEGSQFGTDLFEADYLLKRIGLGTEPSRLDSVPSNWSLVSETLDTLRESRIFDVTSRFWFYPVLRAVKVRQNVASVSGLKVKVFTEVLSASINGRATADLHDVGAEHFARNVSDHFDELASIHPVFARVQVLNELVAVTRAIELLESPVDMEFWLTRYRTASSDTPTRVHELEQKGNVPKASGGTSTMRYQGGVLLQALAIRLNSGDITALRDVVLRTRPNPTTLTWGFAVQGSWIIPGGGSDVGLDAIGEMYSHAAFLIEQKRFDDAMGVYDAISETAPSLRAEALSGKATALFYKALAGVGNAASDNTIRGAIALLKDAVRSKPSCSECLYQLGYVMTVLGMHREAADAFTEALKVNPHEYLAHLGLGIVYYKTEKDTEAITQFREYLKYDSTGPYAQQAQDTLSKLGVNH